MADRRLLPDVVSEPRDVAHAIEIHARIDAFKAWLDARRDHVRAWIEREADAIEQRTSGALNVPVKGVGRALRTDPEPRVVVVDREAFESWFCGEYPDECVIVDRVEVVDHERAAKALRSVDTEKPDAELAGIALQLRDSLKLVHDVLLPEKAEERFTPTESGAVVDDDGQIVDGLEAKTSARQLQVRPDKEFKQALVRELEGLTGGGDG